MAWHRKDLLLLFALLIHAKIFAFDPGDINTASLQAVWITGSDNESISAGNIYTLTDPTKESVTDVQTSEEPVSKSAVTIYESEQPISEPVTKIHTSEEPVSMSVAEVQTSVEAVSETVTKIHSRDEPFSDSFTTGPRLGDGTSSWTLSSQASLPGHSMDTSATNTINTPTTEETSRTPQDVATLSTFADRQYINVDEHGNVSFSHDSTFNVSMPECSMSAYLESYAVLWDLSLFQSLTLDTTDTDPCSGTFRSSRKYHLPMRFGRDAGLTPHYIHAGNLTFRSSDEWFSTNGSYDKSTAAFCLRLRTPPYTELLVRAESIQPWVMSAVNLRVKLFKVEGGRKKFWAEISKYKIERGRQLRSPYNDVVLVVFGLHQAFQEPGRELTLSLTTVPTCKRPRLEVKYPTHNSTGGCLC